MANIGVTHHIRPASFYKPLRGDAISTSNGKLIVEGRLLIFRTNFFFEINSKHQSYEENQFEEHLSLYGHYKWYDYYVYPIVIVYDVQENSYISGWRELCK